MNQFKAGIWQVEINVENFIETNYTLYQGDENFLEKPTKRTQKVREMMDELLVTERERGGCYATDNRVVAGVLAFEPGYVSKELDIIVGLQTDEPLKRPINPFGGLKMTRDALEAYGAHLDPVVEQEFSHRVTHNEGVFSVYTPEMRAARSAGLLTGLPDAYGRGRIIGDYRRVALYGIDRLFEVRISDRAHYQTEQMALGLQQESIQKLEEMHHQINGLKEIKEMAQAYGFDISKPATNAKEAVQWLYFGYLAGIKSQNGAAMSLGRVSTFLDIYMEHDLKNGIITESEAQELMDDFTIKLRLARHLRTPEYNELFGGDPMWITECIGGMTLDGKPLVTKNSFRILHCLYNLGTCAEPNLTVLWSVNLPETFKKYCAKVSCDTDAIQYENDDVMRPDFGQDYSIACCVSAMKVGKDMQFFGARCNLAKLMLLALNGGKDEKTGKQIGPVREPFKGDVLDYDWLMEGMNFYRPWLTNLYVNTMNVIHCMHDKYAYEAAQMALHDPEVRRLMAFGIAGFSVVADSLSAIRYGTVKPIRNEDGLIQEYDVSGDFPCYGNDDDRVDDIAQEQARLFYEDLVKTPTYRGAIHTLSLLTITSNVMYGKKTGSTPDGRKGGEPFAPGANPMHNRETQGALASLNSVAKISYDYCKDGISNTFSIVPDALGKSDVERHENLVTMMDGYFGQMAHHLNVNVLNREVLQDAYEHPEKYPNLTVRVSGYAVNFYKLSKAHQAEVISRTFHQMR
ncbi:MAG: formate C-acetyltransferase [Eubacteriales bacterium]